MAFLVILNRQTLGQDLEIEKEEDEVGEPGRRLVQWSERDVVRVSARGI